MGDRNRRPNGTGRGTGRKHPKGRRAANLSDLPLISLYQPHDMHINWLKVIALQLIGQPSTSSSTPIDLRREQVPWINTEVIVCKAIHPLKGYRAIVKDVQRLQNTLSGLKITAQFTHLNSANPFKTEVLDYDDVVEAS